MNRRIDWLKDALKSGKAVQVDMDLYLLEDGRAVKLDRYRRHTCKWVCDDGYAYRSFFEVLNHERYFVQEHNEEVK